MFKNILNSAGACRCASTFLAASLSASIGLISCNKTTLPVKTAFQTPPVVVAAKVVPKGKNVNDLGIVGDGKTDYTTKIQAAMGTDTALFFPEGDYVVSKTIELNSSNSLTGTQKTRFILAPSVSPDNYFYFFEATGKSNINLVQLGFRGQNTGQGQFYAMSAVSSKNIAFNHITCNLCGIVITGVSGPEDYNSLNFLNQASDNISVDSSSGIGSDAAHQNLNDGVQFRFANHWKISHTTLSFYRNGITWWGGDSNTHADGKAANERKCANGTVDHVHIENIGGPGSGGGIWGSMGTLIKITNSYVNHCTDVGIDFEGCTHSSATGDTIKNCVNGELATFFLCNDLKFDHNLVTSDDESTVLMLINNSDMDPANSDISYTNNTFTTLSGTAALRQIGATANLSFMHNTLQNSIFTGQATNNQNIRISQNTFNFSNRLNEGTYIIEAGHNSIGAQLAIDSNQVNSSVAQPSSVYPIRAYQNEFNNSVVNTLKNNVVTGFGTYCKVTWDSQNGGLTCQTNISSDANNLVHAQSIQKDGNGNQNNSVVYLNGNKL